MQRLPRPSVAVRADQSTSRPVRFRIFANASFCGVGVRNPFQALRARRQRLPNNERRWPQYRPASGFCWDLWLCVLRPKPREAFQMSCMARAQARAGSYAMSPVFHFTTDSYSWLKVSNLKCSFLIDCVRWLRVTKEIETFDNSLVGRVEF